MVLNQTETEVELEIPAGFATYFDEPNVIGRTTSHCDLYLQNPNDPQDFTPPKIITQTSYNMIFMMYYGICENSCEDYDIDQHSDIIDSVYTFSKSGFARWYKSGGVNFLSSLKCGNLYYIILKPHLSTEEPRTLQIPNADVVYYEDGTDLRITEKCDDYLTTPTPSPTPSPTPTPSRPLHIIKDECISKLTFEVPSKFPYISDISPTNICFNNDGTVRVRRT